MHGHKYQNLRFLIDAYETFITYYYLFIYLFRHSFVVRTVLNILLLIYVTARQIPGTTSP
jgi:hypothetical protein